MQALSRIWPWALAQTTVAAPATSRPSGRHCPEPASGRRSEPSWAVTLPAPPSALASRRRTMRSTLDAAPGTAREGIATRRRTPATPSPRLINLWASMLRYGSTSVDRPARADREHRQRCCAQDTQPRSDQSVPHNGLGRVRVRRSSADRRDTGRRLEQSRPAATSLVVRRTPWRPPCGWRRMVLYGCASIRSVTLDTRQAPIDCVAAVSLVAPAHDAVSATKRTRIVARETRSLGDAGRCSEAVPTGCGRSHRRAGSGLNTLESRSTPAQAARAQGVPPCPTPRSTTSSRR